MSQKHIVITGAGSGLGASLARKYAEAGHYISLIGRRVEKLKEVADSFSHSNYSVCSLDVSDFLAVEAVFSKLVAEVGPIDMLFNNAGLGHFALTEHLLAQEVNEMIDINLKGTIFCTQQVIAPMKERDAGSIINIVSTAGLEGKVTESAYCASKFGVKGFTESIIKELEKTNVRVTAVYMGGMHTPFWDGILASDSMQGMMDPDDIADIIMANIHERQNINVPEVIIKNH